MAKLVIDNALLAEEFFEDAKLLGIQCPAEPHRFVWMVNRHFGFDFRYQAGSEVELEKQGRKFSFPIFRFDEQHLAMQHLLYANKFDGEYLLPELRHTDFLWLVKGELQRHDFLNQLEAELRNMPQVQLVSTIANEKIRNKQHLVL